jgi:hypothetical protein
MQPNQTCLGCGKSFPATSEYFHKAKNDTLHARCKECRKQHEKDNKQANKDQRLAEIEKGAVDLFIQAARIGGSNIPHTSELVEVMLEYFGGTRGFCGAFLKQFYDSPSGGAFRTKQLDTVVRLITSNTAVGGAKKPLTHWTEEELEGELIERLRETVVLNALPQRIIGLNEKAPSYSSP